MSRTVGLGVLICCQLLGQLRAAGSAENVLVVANKQSPLSQKIARYYMEKRRVPLAQLCQIDAPRDEQITREVYLQQVAGPVGNCLQSKALTEKILYIVTTSDVPLKVYGPGTGPETEFASVDSELCLLYGDLKGRPHASKGALTNPFFRQRDAEFRHPTFPIYLVTRLTGYNWDDVRGLIDRSLQARNRGSFVIDLSNKFDQTGNDWLRNAALLIPESRTVLEESEKVLYGVKEVIGYAGWGSNDKNRHERWTRFTWLPGAIVTEYVSTDGRTFQRPPEQWVPSHNWGDSKTWFAGAPQSLTADYIHEGATGASGHVYEPFLPMTPRPDFVLPAYYRGRNLAESYYLSIPALSWQNIVVGDPLCQIGPPPATDRK